MELSQAAVSTGIWMLLSASCLVLLSPIRPSLWARGPVAEPRTRPRAETTGICLGPEDPGSPSRSTEGRAGGHGR